MSRIPGVAIRITRRGAALGTAAVLAAAGVTMFALAAVSDGDGPTSPPAAPGHSSMAEVRDLPRPSSAQQRAVQEPAQLPRSVPTRIEIPAIRVDSSLLSLGLNPDDTLEVPPYTEVDHPGWYRDSPTPGQTGPSVIVGHVSSSRYGPGVFYKLGALRSGDQVRVRRTDATTAVFTVEAVDAFPKDKLPRKAIYGDLDHPGLRLITCGGDYDKASGGYPDNTVVFASMTEVVPADR